jgi:CubicO group peptidase (beta-lactamase class C family)
LAAARLLPDGSLHLAADGSSGNGQALLTPDRHSFEIGSITKTFIGLLLADAVVRGELKLDDALETSLPEGLSLRDRDGQPLRWVDVATHRSGLPRLPKDMAPKDSNDPFADYGDTQMLSSLRAFKPIRRRDEAYEYSNFGFGLLGWLLARRSKQSLAALLENRILQPLGLGGPAGMQLRLKPQSGAGLVQGHNAQGQPVPAWHFNAMAGAGALVATAAQLARYGQAALGLVKHPLGEAFAVALKPYSELGPTAKVTIGLAWMLAERNGQKLATHDGGTAGFSSSLWLNLSQVRGGLALANAQVVVTDLARHLTDASSPLRDIDAERKAVAASLAQAAQPLSPEQLAPLTAVYSLSPQFKITVRARGSQLFAQASGQGEFELFAKAERVFFARVTPLELHFDPGAGKPAGLVLHQAGQQLRFFRE